MAEINFVDIDPDTIINEMTADFEAEAGRILSAADPFTILIRWAANIIVQERALINQSAKQNLKQFATGEYLDAIADFLGVTRLPAKAAVTTMRFYLSTALEHDYAIQEGTRIAVDSLLFETEKTAIIKAGNNYIDVIAKCTTNGIIGNGIVEGKINSLVDVFPYYDHCENISTTNGGTDEETDEELRERITLSTDSFSTAGPIGAYIYAVKSVSNDIIDVKVQSEVAGDVNIYFLMSGGNLPSEEMIQAVETALNDEKIRPLTDNINVEMLATHDYEVDVKYFIDSSDTAMISEIQSNVKKAVDDFVLWQKSKIGRDVNPSKLIKMIMEAGAKRVEVNSPSFSVTDETSVAVESEVNISFGGIEDG